MRTKVKKHPRSQRSDAGEGRSHNCKIVGAAERDELLDELASLEPIDYEQQRKQAAKRLGGIRPSVLDDEVAKRRERREQDQADDFDHFDPFRLQPPWPEPVAGDELLNDLCKVIRRHVVLPIEHARAIALWILFAHAHDVARHSPLLVISSPIKRCGKTTLIDVLMRLVPKPVPASNITPAALFRTIDRESPSLLIDEGDTFIAGKSELRGILNCGHTRATCYVSRVEGRFCVWAPKVIALIGRLPPTLEDRSIKIVLMRKLSHEIVQPLPPDDDANLDLHRRCRRWADDHANTLKGADPALPDRLHDRAADNWRPLLAIAEACGGNWPLKAQNAAQSISAADDDEDPAVLLLEDLNKLFEREQGKHLSTAMILYALPQTADRPWADFNRGRAITARDIARLLGPFKIKPRQVLVRGRRVNGYRRDQFDTVFARYLPSASSASPDRDMERVQIIQRIHRAIPAKPKKRIPAINEAGDRVWMDDPDA